MFEKIEIRKHSYANKTAILHIDRIEEFKRKLSEKNKIVKIFEKNEIIHDYEKY